MSRVRTALAALGAATALLAVPRLAAAGVTPLARDVNSILRSMKTALEPARPSLRDLEIVLRDPQGAEQRWAARQARKNGPRGGRIAMVLTSPADIAGAAFLIVEQANGPDAQWEYLPAVRRVRKVFPIGAFRPLLGTDFTYGDLGFINLQRQSESLLGEKTLPDGRRAYEVEERPAVQWYYSRIVDLIAADTFLPVRREFYTPANDLWKVELFEAVTAVDGVPTPMVIRMEDHLDGGSSEIRVQHVHYDVDIPEDVFEPSGLPKLLTHTAWIQAATPAR